jgi:hypothetical protein
MAKWRPHYYKTVYILLWRVLGAEETVSRPSEGLGSEHARAPMSHRGSGRMVAFIITETAMIVL